MILSACTGAATCHPGHSAEWAPLDASLFVPVLGFLFNGLRLYFDSVHSSSRKRFLSFVVALKEEELEGWDVDADGRPRVDRQVSRFGKREFDTDGERLTVRVARYLVCEEESDQLFLVRRYVGGETVDYDVYRIGGDRGLELCSSLDDLAMFVGINHSFAVKASRFPELKPNSIYYSDARKVEVNDRCQTYQTIEIFDYQNKMCSPLSSLSRHNTHLTRMPWFTPTLD